MRRLWLGWWAPEIALGFLGAIGLVVVCAALYRGIYKADGYLESGILLLGGALWLWAVWRSWPRGEDSRY